MLLVRSRRSASSGGSGEAIELAEGDATEESQTVPLGRQRRINAGVEPHRNALGARLVLPIPERRAQPPPAHETSRSCFAHLSPRAKE
jgi:hypothetical protein